eukprot:1159790-Pelagomonas_calceolata.AAC.1
MNKPAHWQELITALSRTKVHMHISPRPSAAMAAMGYMSAAAALLVRISDNRLVTISAHSLSRLQRNGAPKGAAPVNFATDAYADQRQPTLPPLLMLISASQPCHLAAYLATVADADQRQPTSPLRLMLISASLPCHPPAYLATVAYADQRQPTLPLRLMLISGSLPCH